MEEYFGGAHKRMKSGRDMWNGDGPSIKGHYD